MNNFCNDDFRNKNESLCRNVDDLSFLIKLPVPEYLDINLPKAETSLHYLKPPQLEKLSYSSSPNGAQRGFESNHKP